MRNFAKFSRGLVLAYIALVATGVSSIPLSNNDVDKFDVICPEGSKEPSDCYPRVFVPTHEWQSVKEGQEIPAGLHVRLNIYTNEREAKILDPEENETSAESDDKFQELVIVEDNESQSEVKSNGKGYVGRLPPGDLGDALLKLENSVDTELIEPLEFISDQSHDLDYGIEISEYIVPLLRIAGLSNDEEGDFKGTRNTKVTELAISCISSTLRNNPEAQRNIMKYYHYDFDLFLRKLLNQIVLASGKGLKEQLILKRYLNLLSVSFRMTYDLTDLFELLDSFAKMDGDTELLLLFSGSESTLEVRKAVVIVLEDYHEAFAQFKRNNHFIDKRDETEKEEEEETKTHLEKFVDLVQDKLVSSSLLHSSKSRDLLDQLVVLKKQSEFPKFIPSPKFLDWLYYQSEQVKSHILKRENDDNESNDSAIDPNYHHKLLELRHEVFGNKLAMRKAFDDEL